MLVLALFSVRLLLTPGKVQPDAAIIYLALAPKAVSNAHCLSEGATADLTTQN